MFVPLCVVLCCCFKSFDSNTGPLPSGAEPLHKVLSGQGRLTITVVAPTIDCSLADSGDTLRIVNFIENSRLLGLLTGRQQLLPGLGKVSQTDVAASAATSAVPIGQHDTAAAAVTTADMAASASTSAVGGVHSHPIKLTEETTLDEALQTNTTHGSAGSAISSTSTPVVAPRNSSSRTAEAIYTAATLDSPCISTPSSQISSTPDQLSSKSSACEGAKSQAGVSLRESGQQQHIAVPQPPAASSNLALPPHLVQRLQQVDASSHVSAELQFPLLSVFIPDGQLLLPKELG